MNEHGYVNKTLLTQTDGQPAKFADPDKCVTNSPGRL